jgi:dipeptidyl-peptidase-4
MVPRSAWLAWSRAALAWLLLGVCVAAQTKTLTLDDIYSFEGWSRFNGNSTANLGWAPQDTPWLSDTEYLWPGNGTSESPWLRVDAVTGTRRPLFIVDQLESALVQSGVAAEEARRVARRRPSAFNPRRDGFLLTVADDLYYYAIAPSTMTRLTRSSGAKTEATFSPDGRSVAFIKDNNIYVTDVSSPDERALTVDGSADLLHGKLDWVYSEELYGRGDYRGYWWSPDSSQIAFIQLNEKAVPEYTLVDDIPYRPLIERWDYPKAGDPNPLAKLGVVAISGSPVTWIDTAKYEDFLIVSVGWAPDSRSVVYQIQNRQQTWLDLNRADRATGVPTTLLREAGAAWVERWQDSSAEPIWLNDGSFLWLSERSGWRHLYHYRPDGSLIRQVTNGEWETRRVHGVDAERSWIFFSATERTPIGLDVYRIDLDGTGLRRLSDTEGTYRPFFNPSYSLYLESWSDVNTPPQVRLRRTDNREVVRIVDANPVTSLQEYGLRKPEFLQVKTRDGFVMEGMMIRPPDFDPSRRYPVYQFTYAGPHSQQVQNRWGFTDYLYHQLLAQRGVIVWICDNRTSSGKGAQSAWPLYKKFGEVELSDIEDGLTWLKQRPYVDGSRMGISGVSFGGYMTLYALTHSKSFAMGIAAGAVSDWRDYDTIYTERYMGLPQENPEGYRNSSPRFSAASLSGELLLIHGALDDNVHPQNTMQFAYELQKAGKPFQMMVYPRSAHGIADPQLASHMRQMMLAFTLKNLKVD